jgi:hypothetical protein
VRQLGIVLVAAEGMVGQVGVGTATLLCELAQRMLQARLGNVLGARGLEFAGGQVDFDCALAADQERDDADPR